MDAPVDLFLGTEDGTGLTPGPRGGALAPQWPKGVSGNPSGKTKDGRWSGAPKLERALRDELERPGAMAQLAKKWLKLAKDGSAPHLAMIVDRLYPKPQEEQASTQRVIREGIILELTEQGAKLTLAKQTGELVKAEEIPPPGLEGIPASDPST